MIMLLILLLTLLLLTPSHQTVSSPPPNPFRFRILHTNDLHSHLTGTGPDSDLLRATGHFGRLATKIRELQTELPDATVTLDGGDIYSGTLYHLLAGSPVFRFFPEMEFLEYCGYDGVVLGNHDFDAGVGLLGDKLEKASRSGVSIPILGSDLEFVGGSKETDLLVRRYVLRGNGETCTNDSSTKAKKTDDNSNSKAPFPCFSEEIRRSYTGPRESEYADFKGPYFVPYILKELRDGERSLRVAVIGTLGAGATEFVAKQTAVGISRIAYDNDRRKILFDAYVKHLWRSVKYVRERHPEVDVVVILAHSGKPEDQNSIKRAFLEKDRADRWWHFVLYWVKWLWYYVVRRCLQGLLRGWMPDLEPFVHVHISSHTHVSYLEIDPVLGTFYSQTAPYSSELGVLVCVNAQFSSHIPFLLQDFEFDGMTKRLTLLNPESTKIPMDSEVSLDPEIVRRISEYDKVLNRVMFVGGENRLSEGYPFADVSFAGEFEALDWLAQCMYDALNLKLVSEGKEKVDVYLMLHGYVRYGASLFSHRCRMNYQTIQSFANRTRIQFSDAFRYYGGGHQFLPYYPGDWSREEVVSIHIEESLFIATIPTFFDLAGMKMKILNASFGGATFRKRKWGIPFLRSDRLGRLYDFKFPTERKSGSLVNMAMRRSLYHDIATMESMSKGFIKVRVYDSDGNIAEPVPLGLNEPALFLRCLKMHNETDYLE